MVWPDPSVRVAWFRSVQIGKLLHESLDLALSFVNCCAELPAFPTAADQTDAVDSQNDASCAKQVAWAATDHNGTGNAAEHSINKIEKRVVDSFR